MPPLSELDKLLPEISAIPRKAIKVCPMPIGIYAQEAENLYHWCQPDAELLARAGLEATWIDALLPRVNALREAEARWQTEYRLRQAAAQEWSERRPLLYKFRDDTLRSFRYALRKNKQALRVLSGIAEDNTHAQLVQDLSMLELVGNKYRKELEKINFDLASLKQPEMTASYVGQLIARSKQDKYDNISARTCRDQAYIYLKQAVDEVRECGKFVFNNNKHRYKGYCSAYFRKVNSQRNSANPADQPDAS